MRPRPVELERKLTALVIASVVLAAAYLVQGPTVNASSHHALTRALASGTPRVDETRHQIGDVGTTDVAWYEGHAYSNKAPGLAVVVLPAYLVLEAFGKTASSDPSLALWSLGLLGLIVPLALLLGLVHRIVEQVRPGLGGPTAVTLGFGTLLLPFATLFFAHVLSAFLAFAAFVCLWTERRGPPRLELVALAGLLVALATTVEYPVALIGLVLLPYALARERTPRRPAAYVGAGAVGLLPLALYNWWALGSPFRLTYRYSVLVPGESGRDVLVSDVPFSELFHVPGLDDLANQLFHAWGLVTAAPVLALVPVGLVALARRGYRAEALVTVSAVGALGLYAASYYAPYGDTWAPRFLIPAIPFFALPLALGLARLPALGATLAVASIGLTAAVTLTNPMAAWDGHILDRLFSAGLSQHARTVLEFAGVIGWWDSLPFVAAAVFAAAYTAVTVIRSASYVRREDAAAAAFALLGWATFAQVSPRALVRAPDEALLQGVVLLALVAAVVVPVIAVERGFGRSTGSALRAP